MGWTAEQSMAALKSPEAERPQYVGRLQRMLIFIENTGERAEI